MRLLNINSEQLAEFQGSSTIPNYAILSHTWGEEEVSFRDISEQLPGYKDKLGYQKIKGCCEKLRNYCSKYGLDKGRFALKYVWIDTCCIDKSSSAELSEAINSMFEWYRRAEFCVVYLSDVSSGESLSEPGSKFRQSRWYGRGWTLQELLAPADVRFCNADWRWLGSKAQLAGLIEEITGIESQYLRGAGNIRLASVAERFRWAASRQTTREEDIAYSLLGIFGVNMPMLYGEGTRAFIRLQEEIIKSSDDQSFLTWGLGISMKEMAEEIELKQKGRHSGIFASSPYMFRHCSYITRTRLPGSSFSSPFSKTNAGLRIKLPIVSDLLTNSHLAVLGCQVKGLYVALPLCQSKDADDAFHRLPSNAPVLIHEKLMRRPNFMKFYLRDEPIPTNLPHDEEISIIDNSLTGAKTSGWTLVEVFPPTCRLRDTESSRFLQLARNKCSLSFLIYALPSSNYTFVVRIQRSTGPLELEDPDDHTRDHCGDTTFSAQLATLPQCPWGFESSVLCSRLLECTRLSDLDGALTWTDRLEFEQQVITLYYPKFVPGSYIQLSLWNSDLESTSQSGVVEILVSQH